MRFRRFPSRSRIHLQRCKGLGNILLCKANSFVSQLISSSRMSQIVPHSIKLQVAVEVLCAGNAGNDPDAAFPLI